MRVLIDPVVPFPSLSVGIDVDGHAPEMRRAVKEVIPDIARDLVALHDGQRPTAHGGPHHGAGPVFAVCGRRSAATGPSAVFKRYDITSQDDKRRALSTAGVEAMLPAARTVTMLQTRSAPVRP